MKRMPKLLPKHITLLDLTLEDLEVLLDDEGGLISHITGFRHPNALDDTQEETAPNLQGKVPTNPPEEFHINRHNKHFLNQKDVISSNQPEEYPSNQQDAPPLKWEEIIHTPKYTIYSDVDLCLYFVEGDGGSRRVSRSHAIFHFLDTTDLPDWQEILQHLHWEQHRLNSLGDE